MTERRFPPPWSAEIQPNYYVARDANGQQLAYVHYSNDPDRRSAAKLLTKDEARRIAANLGKLRYQPGSPTSDARHTPKAGHNIV